MEKPSVISSKQIYDGWLKLRVDTVKVPGSDKNYNYDVVTIGDGVAILPFIDKDTLLLSRQYRHPVEDTLLEVIQGGIGKNETKEQAAHRELLEETGFACTLAPMTTVHLMPGSLCQKIHIYKGSNLRKVQEPETNPLEKMELVKVKYDGVLKEIIEGKHKDSVLAISVLHHFASTHLQTK